MRQARLRGQGAHFVHAISRIIERRFILGNQEKHHFLSLMRQLENFMGLTVVSYALLDNHVHLLIEQPDRDDLPDLTRDELLRRLHFIYDSHTVKDIEQEIQRAEAAGDKQWRQNIFNRYTRRMGDVSKFMQELKQRFSQWYNRRNSRKGTLWEERFKSVLVEADEEALMTMAAYIDLNAVRANIVASPEDYHWCSYGAAMGGDRQARAGLGKILDHSQRVCGDDFESRWGETSKLYRWWLYQEGEQVEADPETGEKGRVGFSRETVEHESTREGRISLAEKLHCRIRYLTRGAVFGSTAFVEAVFENNRNQFGAGRTTGARKMRGGHWGRMRVLRQVQRE